MPTLIEFTPEMVAAMQRTVQSFQSQDFLLQEIRRRIEVCIMQPEFDTLPANKLLNIWIQLEELYNTIASQAE